MQIVGERHSVSIIWRDQTTFKKKSESLLTQIFISELYFILNPLYYLSGFAYDQLRPQLLF